MAPGAVPVNPWRCTGCGTRFPERSGQLGEEGDNLYHFVDQVGCGPVVYDPATVGLDFSGFASFEEIPVFVTVEEFHRLPEYSCSIPTGPRPGFRWKRQVPFGRPGFGTRWLIAEAGPEYEDWDDLRRRRETYVSITWAPLLVADDYRVPRLQTCSRCRGVVFFRYAGDPRDPVVEHEAPCLACRYTPGFEVRP